MSGDDDDDDDESVGTSGRTPPHRSFLSFFSSFPPDEDLSSGGDHRHFGWPPFWMAIDHRTTPSTHTDILDRERGRERYASCSTLLIADHLSIGTPLRSFLLALCYARLRAHRGRKRQRDFPFDFRKYIFIYPFSLNNIHSCTSSLAFSRTSPSIIDHLFLMHETRDVS